MKIYHDYLIKDILESDPVDDEMSTLRSKVLKYKENVEKQITDILSKAPSAEKKEVMCWINENVPECLKSLVRQAYLGKDYNVLKKHNNSWKKLSDIAADAGIEIIREVSLAKENNCENWLKGLEEKGKKYQKFENHIFDTHAHYDHERFRGRIDGQNVRDTLLKLLHSFGIDKCISPAIDYGTNTAMVELFSKPEYGWLYFAFGSHPKYLWKEAADWDECRWSELRKMLQNPKCVALGEVGLDYSYPQFCLKHRELQKDFFVKFIEIANEQRLPVILHLRSGDIEEQSRNIIVDADEDAMRIITEHPIKYGAVCHCFGGNIEKAEKYSRLGVNYFGIGARIFYGEKDLEETVKKLPEKAILLETDTPYVKIPGSMGPNTSFSLYDVAEKVAEIRETSAACIIEMAYKNAKRLFRV